MLSNAGLIALAASGAITAVCWFVFSIAVDQPLSPIAPRVAVLLVFSVLLVNMPSWACVRRRVQIKPVEGFALSLVSTIVLSLAVATAMGWDLGVSSWPGMTGQYLRIGVIAWFGIALSHLCFGAQAQPKG